MQATDLGATEEALVMFRYKVRRALRDQQGYECQEAAGDFMLAFTSPAEAVRFCLSVCLCWPFGKPSASLLLCHY